MESLNIQQSMKRSFSRPWHPGQLELLLTIQASQTEEYEIKDEGRRFVWHRLDEFKMAHLLRICVVNTISFRKGWCHTLVCFLVRINQGEVNTMIRLPMRKREGGVGEGEGLRLLLNKLCGKHLYGINLISRNFTRKQFKSLPILLKCNKPCWICMRRWTVLRKPMSKLYLNSKWSIVTKY